MHCDMIICNDNVKLLIVHWTLLLY